MTKKELLEALQNVDENAVILFGKNDFSNYIATDIYLKDGDEKQVIITNNIVTIDRPVFSEKIF